jgi:hypothetical protein
VETPFSEHQPPRSMSSALWAWSGFLARKWAQCPQRRNFGMVNDFGIILKSRWRPTGPHRRARPRSSAGGYFGQSAGIVGQLSYNPGGCSLFLLLCLLCPRYCFLSLVPFSIYFRLCFVFGPIPILFQDSQMLFSVLSAPSFRMGQYFFLILLVVFS